MWTIFSAAEGTLCKKRLWQSEKSAPNESQADFSMTGNDKLQHHGAFFFVLTSEYVLPPLS